MLFILISLLLLPFAQCETENCKFYPAIRKAGGKTTDCLAQDHGWKVAQCLLQLNTLDYTMQCAGWKRDESLSFSLSRHPHAQDIDIVPSLNTYDVASGTWNPVKWERDYDDRITFTPRGLIVAAAQYCRYQNVCRKEFFGQVLACPFEDMHEFIPCLKCEGTTAKDIETFEGFIQRKQFGRISYDLPPIMNWRKYADLATCDDELDPDEDGDDDNVNIKARAQGEATASYLYTYTRSIRYPISNPPTPDATGLPSNPTQTADDEEEEEDESRNVAAKTVKRKEAAPTTTSPAKNGTGRYAVVDISVLGTLSVVITLLLV
ncbi:hypothetical protein FPCIR_4258 [Fusarium pseudocircinatum]|uniref:Uncharacterized protein n=1 Tax=Fusarium pseudocircinatum TaxID=56676 RepID=A0A8H5PFU0_9HYPO|nr:hypothetical protein FPCIR_4258 [Fusarium pseudocircinatum]